MKLKLFALQTSGTAAALGAAWLLLLVPDSTLGYLALSLALMYATLFVLSFTLAAVAGGLDSAQRSFMELLGHGWRKWYRAGAVLLIAAALLYGLYRLGWSHAAVWAPIVLLALLAVPLATQWHSLQAVRGDSRLLRRIAYVVLAAALAFASWKIISTPAELSRPWLEIAYLGARMLVSFLVLNVACMLLLAAGQFSAKSQST